MAGTGYSYEIANATEVRSLLEDAASGLEPGQGADWFKSRKLVRYLTSERFTVKVSRDQAEGAVDAFDVDDRDRLVAKIESGGDVRLFSREIFAAAGPDLDHLADWASWVCRNDPRLCRKLARITVEQAIARADAWTATVSSLTPVSRGSESLFMETAAGQSWMSLDDSTALRAEGYAMSHCVGEYAGRLESGTSRIFSLRDGSGRSLLTAEFVKEGERNRLRQAYAFGNGAAPPQTQRCLAQLMDRLEAVDSPAAAGAGLCFVDGSWKRMIDTWERVEWRGHSGVASGRCLIVMSPRNPATPLLKALFSQNGWMESTQGQQVVVSALEERHFHIVEQRVFAEVCTLAGADRFTSAGGGSFQLVKHEGRLHPARDLWERRNFGGTECLVETTGKGDIFHVTHSKDEARTLLRFGESRLLYGKEDGYGSMSKSLAGLAGDSVRWNRHEAMRCMAAATEAGVSSFGTSDDAGKEVWRKFRPIRLPDGEWRLFMDEAESVPCLSGPGTWLRTSYRAELTGRGYEHATVMRNADGKVNWVSMFGLDESFVGEVAAFLNREGWEPARRVQGLQEQKYDGPSGARPCACLHFVGGKWIACTSLESLIAAAVRKPKGKRRLVLAAAEAEALMAMLPEESFSEDGERLLAAAFETWAKTAKAHAGDDVLLEQHGVMRLSSWRWSSSWEGRLRVASRLMPEFQERTRKQVGRIACMVAREAMRGRPGGYFDPRRDTLVRLVADFHEHFSDALLRRALKRGLRHSNSLVGKGDASPSAAWFGPVLERATTSGQLWMLADSADSTTYRFPKDDIVLSFDDACNWLECYRLAMRRHWHFHASSSIFRFIDIVRSSAEAEGPGCRESWQGLVAEAEAMGAEHGRPPEGLSKAA